MTRDNGTRSWSTAQRRPIRCSQFVPEAPVLRYLVLPLNGVFEPCVPAYSQTVARQRSRRCTLNDRAPCQPAELNIYAVSSLRSGFEQSARALRRKKVRHHHTQFLEIEEAVHAVYLDRWCSRQPMHLIFPTLCAGGGTPRTPAWCPRPWRLRPPVVIAGRTAGYQVSRCSARGAAEEYVQDLLSPAHVKVALRQAFQIGKRERVGFLGRLIGQDREPRPTYKSLRLTLISTPMGTRGQIVRQSQVVRNLQ